MCLLSLNALLLLDPLSTNLYYSELNKYAAINCPLLMAFLMTTAIYSNLL